MILAMPPAASETPPNPKMAATTDTIAKMIAHFSIGWPVAFVPSYNVLQWIAFL